MSKFERHIFVCENQRDADNPKGCCKTKGAEDIRQTIKIAMDKAGLRGRMRCNSAGCLDACEYGPAVVVYPEGVWYTVPTVADAEEIVREHMVAGRVVERLRMPTKPRAPKA
jgi:(2Fe-2S) ferredoxin